MRQLKFGIELEVATSKSQEEVVEALQNAGIDTIRAGYGSPTSTSWKVQYDGSINGWEIVSPPLTNTDELEIVCHVLRKELKCRSSVKTGLHIHHDISDLNLEQIKNIYSLYAKYELNAIQSIQSPARQNNTYCRPISTYVNQVLNSNSIEEFKKAVPTRYVTLNNKAYVKYGTIEFRGAQGTVEIDRIKAWIELTHKLVETAAEKTEVKKLYQGRTNEEALEIMFEEFNLSEKTKKHYKKVQKFFSKLA